MIRIYNQYILFKSLFYTKYLKYKFWVKFILIRHLPKVELLFTLPYCLKLLYLLLTYNQYSLVWKGPWSSSIPHSLFTMDRNICWVRLLKASSNLAFNASNDGASAILLGNMFVFLTTSVVKNLNLQSLSLKPPSSLGCLSFLDDLHHYHRETTVISWLLCMKCEWK